jgi:hypothetical protein
LPLVFYQHKNQKISVDLLLFRNDRGYVTLLGRGDKRDLEGREDLIGFRRIIKLLEGKVNLKRQ